MFLKDFGAMVPFFMSSFYDLSCSFLLIVYTLKHWVIQVMGYQNRDFDVSGITEFSAF